MENKTTEKSRSSVSKAFSGGLRDGDDPRSESQLREEISAKASKLRKQERAIAELEKSLAKFASKEAKQERKQSKKAKKQEKRMEKQSERALVALESISKSFEVLAVKLESLD